MKNSLRLRLLAGTVAIVAVIWLALAVTAWHEARHEAEEIFDAHLAQTAALLAAFVGDEADEIEEHLAEHHYARKVAFQIWADGKRLLAHSSTAPDVRLSKADAGFSDSSSGGQRWRVYSLWDKKAHYLIQVAEAREAREDISRQLAGHLLLPLLVALPLLALALVLLIGASLAPLDRLAASISQRSPERLEAIPLEGSPRELHPILDRLNGLLGRIAQSIEQERRFTADAAHELRTPLAAMRTHAQVAQGSRDAAERDQALARVVEATDRATHLVEQLLMLARLDATGIVGKFVPCDLRAIAAEAVALAAPSALQWAVEVELCESTPVTVAGEATLLGVALRNLIDNAGRYSPPGTRVRVTAGADPSGSAYVEVVDSGPGIASDERARVVDRFYRLCGSGETGSGLGLSIVAKVAELHGARLELLDGPGGKGLRARVVFGKRGND
jgi:two-component system sensor histidine kinase QseC